MRTTITAIVVLLLALPAAVAKDATYRRLNCEGLALVAAKGVPDAPKHRYQARGICVLEIDEVRGERTFEQRIRLWIEADMLWDEKQGTLEESAEVDNQENPKASGELHTVYRCARDPMIHPPSCQVVSHDNSTGQHVLTAILTTEQKPLLAGRTSLAEASALSAKSGSAAPPPPPPPAPKKKPKLQQAPPTAGTAAPTTTPPRAAGRPLPTPPETPDDTVMTFQDPVLDGYRVDYCFAWGDRCGKPAATAFCVAKGYAGALEWQIAEDIGATSPTRTQGDKRICDQPACDGFFKITCSK